MPTAGKIMVVCFVLAALRCDQIGSMHNQPRYEALEPSEFFFDRTTARPSMPGTVPRQRGFADEGELNPAAAAHAEMTADVLDRGQALFAINCSVCHGYAGYGDGIVALRGYPAPPSYHTPRLRNLPDEHMFHVITNGLGKMPAYRNKVRAGDRRAIIAYIRALQLSQHAPVELLSARMREELGRSSSPHDATVTRESRAAGAEKRASEMIVQDKRHQ